MATKKRYVDDGDQPTVNSVIGGDDPDAIGAPVDDGDQPTVNSVIYGDDPDAIGGATAVPSTSPGGGGQTTIDIVEEVVEEVQEPWISEDPTLGSGTCGRSGKVSSIKVEEAPAYEKSAEQLAWEEMHSGTIQDIIGEKGYGIPEETPELIQMQLLNTLKTREAENIRLLQQDMERRGITDSGLYFSEEQKIKATTTRALATGVTDIKIKSAFMKMASFEKALGLSAQFLSYLSRESELAYAPKMATWYAKQQAKLVEYQAAMEIKKINLMQHYAQQNMYLQAKLTSELNTQMHTYNVEIAQMEIDAAKERAKAEMGANVFGAILGAISGGF